jgi:hypothetical protein
MLDNEQVRLIVNIDDLRDYDRAYADGWVAAALLMIVVTDVCSSLLLQPTSYLPAFDAALLQLVQALHDPGKHKITGNECEHLRVGMVEHTDHDCRLCRTEGIVRSTALQPQNTAE